MTTPTQSPPIIKFVPAAVLLGGLGWTGIVWLFVSTLPTAGPRWLFFLCLFLAMTGTALPVIAFLNRRFPGKLPATQNVIVRQASWIGFYAAVLAWLQIGRVMTSALAIMVAAGLGLIEWLLRVRERSEWRG